MNPFVSICCITYNHQRYIRDAIDSFLMQKTSFPFEIIIYDDASIDDTAEIIKEYAHKNPELIRPIYQTENQYSNGEQVILTTFRAAKGKYVAICEGDDYWTDPLKLEKQVREMEKNPDCFISYHSAIRIWADNRKKMQKIALKTNTTTIVSVEDVILGGGGFMPTASIMLNREVIPRIISFFESAKEAPIGDYYIQILGAERGGALYLNDTMCVYRAGVYGSYSERLKRNQSDIDLRLFPLISCNDKINTFTCGRFSVPLDVVKRRYYSDVAKSLFLDVNTKQKILGSYISKLGFKDWFLLFLLSRFPTFKHSLQLINYVVMKIRKG